MNQRNMPEERADFPSFVRTSSCPKWVQLLTTIRNACNCALKIINDKALVHIVSRHVNSGVTEPMIDVLRKRFLLFQYRICLTFMLDHLFIALFVSLVTQSRFIFRKKSWAYFGLLFILLLPIDGLFKLKILCRV